MSYLHCHYCYWGQDDFWSDTYNPIRYLLNWEEALLTEDLEQPFTDDAGFIEERGNLTYRELLAQECEKAARTIRRMKWRTFDEYKPDGQGLRPLCPSCGKGLDID